MGFLSPFRWLETSARGSASCSKVFIHHGETEHATWYNVLAVRLASLGCMSLAMDAQGFGQSDGARGYFETFEEVKDDFIGETIFALGHFCF